MSQYEVEAWIPQWEYETFEQRWVLRRYLERRHIIEARCHTEAANMAYGMARSAGAVHVNFGPPVERDAAGRIVVNERRTKNAR